MITLVVLSRMDILGRYYVIFIKGDNFCDLLFALMYAKPLLKRGLLYKERKGGLLYKERIWSLWEQILSLYRADPFSEGDKNNIDRVDFLESESLPHKMFQVLTHHIKRDIQKIGFYFALKHSVGT